MELLLKVIEHLPRNLVKTEVPKYSNRMSCLFNAKKILLKKIFDAFMIRKPNILRRKREYNCLIVGKCMIKMSSKE